VTAAATEEGAPAATVLVVEDSRVQAEALRLGLEKCGYRVRLADDGAAGLAEARAEAPDVVLSDIDMPEMDGYELCRAIKADTALRHVPVILLTAYAEPEDIFRGLEAHADSYLTKPCDEETLRARVDQVLANRALRGRRQRHGVEVIHARRRHRLDNDSEQVLELLMSSLDNARQHTARLEARVQQLESERRQLRDEVARLRAGKES
jgi:CheY-like chemotaxis protein